MTLLKSHAEKVADAILSEIEAATKRLLITHKKGFAAVWESTTTPDEVFATLGTRGAQVVNVASAVVQLLLTVDPTILAPAQFMPRREMTLNADGTVTLSDPPEGYDAWGREIIPDPNE